MSISSDQWRAQFYHDAATSDSTAVLHGGGPNNSNSKPRRRSRASRKAPTTLLNASTANFRDLVQQFTGFHAAGASLPLGSHKGPVNLSFGQAEDGLHNNHPSVMLPFSDARHFQLRQPPPEQRFPFQPEIINGVSRPAAGFMEIQNLIDEDLNFDLEELAMEFSSNSTGNGNGNYAGGYFP